MPGKRTVWLVERTYSDDEQNLIILVYALPDGSKRLVQERALSSFSEADKVTAALKVSEERLNEVDDEELRERYRREADRMRERYEESDYV